jgi:hypothetical protein
MPYEAADILITGAHLFYAPLDTAVPADTLGYGAAWGGSWVSVGYTLEPLQLSYRFEITSVMTEQTNSPVKTRRRSEQATFRTTLGEHNSSNLALAMAAQATVTSPGVGQPGKEEIDLGGDTSIPLKMWGAEGLYEDDSGNQFPVRVFMWRAHAAEGADLAYARENPTGIPLNISLLSDFSKVKGKQLLKIQRITAAATG